MRLLCVIFLCVVCKFLVLRLCVCVVRRAARCDGHQEAPTLRGTRFAILSWPGLTIDARRGVRPRWVTPVLPRGAGRNRTTIEDLQGAPATNPLASTWGPIVWLRQFARTRSPYSDARSAKSAIRHAPLLRACALEPVWRCHCPTTLDTWATLRGSSAGSCVNSSRSEVNSRSVHIAMPEAHIFPSCPASCAELLPSCFSSSISSGWTG